MNHDEERPRDNRPGRWAGPTAAASSKTRATPAGRTLAAGGNHAAVWDRTGPPTP